MKRALVSAAITAAGVALSASPAWAAGSSGSTPAGSVATVAVAPGDSYWSIAQRYGVTMQNLAAFNDASLWSPLDAGITLGIPPAGWTAQSAPAPSAAVQPGAVQPAATHRAANTVTSTAPSGVWACIAHYESGSNPAADTGNGYFGMYQFTPSTWREGGGTGSPAGASAAEQTAVAQRVQAQQGWGAWPTTSRLCGV